MLNGKTCEFGYLMIPACIQIGHILGGENLAERCVVCLYIKFAVQQEMAESRQGIEQCKSFPIVCREAVHWTMVRAPVPVPSR